MITDDRVRRSTLKCTSSCAFKISMAQHLQSPPLPSQAGDSLPVVHHLGMVGQTKPDERFTLPLESSRALATQERAGTLCPHMCRLSRQTGLIRTLCGEEQELSIYTFNLLRQLQRVRIRVRVIFHKQNDCHEKTGSAEISSISFFRYFHGIYTNAFGTHPHRNRARLLKNSKHNPQTMRKVLNCLVIHCILDKISFFRVAKSVYSYSFCNR